MTAANPLTPNDFSGDVNVISARVAPIRRSFLVRVRTEGRDDLGQQVKRVIARGGEPCRDVLRRAQPGEELILASYSPFANPGPYKEYGPIFVLAEESSEPIRHDALQAGSESNYLRAQFAIRAYSNQEEIIDAVLVDARSGQSVVDNFFARTDVAFLHVRFPTYGCFACRFDRT